VPDLRERILRPREGWTALALLIVMVLSLAWSVGGAAWLRSADGPLLDFLVPVGVFAVVCGALLGVTGLSVVYTLPIGALIGGAIVLWTIGGEYFTRLDQLGRLFALRDELVSWTIVALRTGYPLELSPWAIGLGLLMWTTAFIAGYTVYRHHRVLDAILLIGALLIANMSAIITDLFVWLLIFVIAAMLLWLRTSLMTRQEGWQRRRVNENAEVPTSIVRSGLVFTVGTIALAWILTTVAVAAPLTQAWRGLDGIWSGVQDQFEGVFGGLTNPQSRLSGSSFGSSFMVDGTFVSNDREALVVAATRGLYLRAVTYDVYTGRGWERSEGAKRDVPAGELLFSRGTSERPENGQAFEAETITIAFRQSLGRTVFTAGYPVRVFLPTRVHETANAPVLGGLEAPTAFVEGEAYELVVAISDATEAELRDAGTEYPEVVSDHFLDASRVTDGVAELAATITEGAETPYDQAQVLADYLSDDASFTYDTQAPVPRPEDDLVDFFLLDPDHGRIGYCEYYASAMVMMARSLGIPGRIATGFAPGERTEDGLYLVREANAHAWAELYFPGYGWQIFEATKSIDPQFVRRSGEAVPPRVTPPNGVDTLEALEAAVDRTQGRTIPSTQPAPGAILPGQDAAADPTREGNLLIFIVLTLLALGVIWFQVRRVQRGWRGLPPGERSWRRLALAAGRAGVAQRPAETIYEYAGWLEEQIPSRRPEIKVIADGKVWQSYSGRPIGFSAANAIERAWERLRLPFVALTVRHWLRNLFRRG
jgi:transglutaminase-like putative cysteine protease